MKIAFSTVVLLSALVSASVTAVAQKETSAGVEVERDLALLRRDLRTEKKKIIAANLSLTETEATKFWPVYDQYIADITKPYDAFYASVKDFVAQQKTLSDAESSAFIKRWGQLLVEIAQTRQRYIPMVEKVIPPRKAAVFFQIDRRLYSLLELQVVTEMPLIQQP
ncbi:MAG TPA: hypothetical protein VLA93_21040 [Pyrinomonadaceae bacterium]|nr:hypothetical protein [Pyrinomonadaceae bacterium]